MKVVYTSVMRFLYTSLLYLLLPFAFLRLWLRSFKAAAYRQRWAERLGYFKSPVQTPSLWLHAVSLGEVNAASPLIKALLQRYPNTPLVITTMTITGSETVERLFGSSVFHVYLPYDLPFAIKGFLKRTQPKLAIIMETELWPNLFHHCAKRSIPLTVVNARLSTHSFKNYQRLGKLIHPILNCVSILAAQTAGDAERFIQLGLSPERAQILGNIKFDVSLDPKSIAAGKALRESWGRRPVWIAASTHAGEEEYILDAFTEIKKRLPEALLVLVPRHPQRFDEVIALCSQRFKVLSRTQQKELNKNCDASTDVFVGNTLGEMPLFYATADVAFLGGSLVPIGGHNLLEPAMLSLPTLTGPHLFNFTEISQLLIRAGATIKIEDPKMLATETISLLTDPARCHQMGEKGQTLVLEEQGALVRYLQLIETLLGKNSYDFAK